MSQTNKTESWQEKLAQVVRELSEEKRQEIIDFAEYLRERQVETDEKKESSFAKWVGLALKGPVNPNPRFKTEDDLWADDL